MTVKTQIQVRRDTAANWAGKTLADGEIGFVNSGTDKGKFKIGDGSTTWASLPYANPDALVTAVSGALSVDAGTLSVKGTARYTGSSDTLDGTNPYPKITVKSGSTGPATPVVGDVWIKF